MTYYISQGRVEASIRIGVQLCYSSVANSFQYLLPKIVKIQCSWTKLLQKIKGAIFFAPQCTNKNYIVRLSDCPGR